ncbi:ATP-binding protein [Rivularia sp. UHCC 0363]|uniref:ATP-binding protein n=1 Tax=Rivularia sp. UHCC 0363 TaxID=3110244 RepID=UPI002B21836B|nr:ATP-binding protein [Rivularia sp. UHCC 0363]MEA5594739.1 ATP-binding protein [Rivularia sp. UHCC 0363]
MTAIKPENKPAAKTNSQPLAHFLIGPPGSGKSSFAQILSQIADCEITSTDNIREELYGDAKNQGEWFTIESTAIDRIFTALKLGKSIIYDATNVKRPFRMDFLGKVEARFADSELSQFKWIGWYLTTPLETCKEWNQQRQRQVDEGVIENMFKSLQNFSPIPGEGFAVVNKIDVTSSQCQLQVTELIETIPRQVINSQNRYANITPHRYSNLLDFERLMHLISLIIEFPGIGELHSTNPKLLENILGSVQDTTSIQEITAMMAKLRGVIYAKEDAIAADLEWLANEGIINHQLELGNSSCLMVANEQNISNSFNSRHSYSDKESFQRLIGTIGYILRYPFLVNTGGGCLKTLTEALAQAGIIDSSDKERDIIRKDIEIALKPYKILPDFSMRSGYFAGTGIFSKPELIKLFAIIQSQVKILDDPQALEIYQVFQQRLSQTNILQKSDTIYPVRAIANNTIVNPKYLHSSAVGNNIAQLETAIVEARLLEVKLFDGAGRYIGDEKDFFKIYPLQIIFFNFAWYLGYESVTGETSGLLKFERLDRLFLGKTQTQQRSRKEQEKKLDNLQKLQKAGAGIHLGNSSSDQKLFLSSNQQEKTQVCVMVELWFNDKIYSFITEGTKRFAKMKMSPPIKKTTSNLPKSLFSLAKTGDANFPHRFQATFPKWTLNDFDLWKWIVSFGGGVKVVTPQELIEKVKVIGEGIVGNYESKK